MKTNQVIQRHMDSFVVQQRTSDGMFNATGLLTQWNQQTGSQKQMVHYFDNKNTEAFVEAIMKEENFKQRNSVYLKSRGKYNGGTWMHPLMFVDFAMWLNPTFKVKVLKFVYDQMIKYRNDAGDAYKELSAAISRLTSKEHMPAAMAKLSKAINTLVFGYHQPMIRNQRGDEAQQFQLLELERTLTNLINDQFLTTFDEVMEYLRKKWRQKYMN